MLLAFFFVFGFIYWFETESNSECVCKCKDRGRGRRGLLTEQTQGLIPGPQDCDLSWRSMHTRATQEPLSPWFLIPFPALWLWTPSRLLLSTGLLMRAFPAATTASIFRVARGRCLRGEKWYHHFLLQTNALPFSALVFHGGFWYQKGVLLKHRDETTGQKKLSRRAACVNFTSSLPLASGEVQHMGNIRKARVGKVGGKETLVFYLLFPSTTLM